MGTKPKGTASLPNPQQPSLPFLPSPPSTPTELVSSSTPAQRAAFKKSHYYTVQYITVVIKGASLFSLTWLLDFQAKNSLILRMTFATFS